MRRIVRILGLGLLGALLVGAPVNAGKPLMEQVPVDDQFVDGFLSGECGTEVTAHVSGHIIFRTFIDANGDAVREVNNFALSVSYESANGAVHAKDVGVDRVTYLDDGSIIRVVIGSVQSFSVPGEGRVYADVGQTTILITFDGNGDPIFTVTGSHGQHDDNQIEALCSVLG